MFVRDDHLDDSTDSEQIRNLDDRDNKEFQKTQNQNFGKSAEPQEEDKGPVLIKKKSTNPFNKKGNDEM